MRNAIFCDPNFVEHFLPGNSSRLDAVLEHCRRSEAYDSRNRRWKLPGKIGCESKLYHPVRNTLNAIKHCVDAISHLSLNDLENGLGSSQDEQITDTLSNADPDDVPLMPDFQDRSSRPIESDEADAINLKPDIVLFDTYTHEHWETVRMPIEIKKRPQHHKAGMKQLSRYARAVFAHQLHRRHLYGMMVCGTEATFVRFDRAGILYSPRIDMRKDSDGFTRAFASLLMLDRADEGYDTAFTTELFEGRLKYYITLPESAFKGSMSTSVAGPSSGPKSVGVERTRKFEVLEKLCHRKSICGRATIVLRLRELQDGSRTTKPKAKRKRDESERPKPREYVLKLIWRDPARDSEGEVMKRFRGMFGLAQYVWHCDAPGRCHCPSPGEELCWTCGDETAQVDGLQVCDNLRNIEISVPIDGEGRKEPELELVDTTQHRSTSSRRKRRIYSYILISSIGVPLSAAEDPPQFMTAVLDAILGYWRLFNLGILHRDISEGNVMMLDKVHNSTGSEWKEPTKELELDDLDLAESENKLREVLVKLSRGPSGMLSDFDLHAKHMHTVGAFARAPNQSTGTAATRSPLSDSTESRSTVELPEAKRRTTNSRRSLPVSISDAQANVSRASAIRPEQASQVQDRRQGKIDFRTGTPAFMSIRVSSIEPGMPYHHNYLDDLESFFWLILWSAAAHIDIDVDYPTNGAQYVLDSMDQDSLRALADWKRSHLSKCRSRNGGPMKELLKSFNNKWASHPIFVNVILRLGVFFQRIEDGEFPEETTPASMFSSVVDILMLELGLA